MTLFQLILIQIVFFALIIFGLRKLLYTQASVEIKRLQVMADENNKKIESLKRQIKEAETEYKRKIDQANADAKQLIDDAKKEAEALRGKAMDEAREETDKMVKFAQSKKQGLEKEMKSEIMRKTIDLSGDIIKKVLSADSLTVTHEAMIEELAQHMDEMDLGRVDKGVKEAEVTTIFPLKKETKEMLKKKLTDKLGRAVSVREKIDDSVVAGIIVRLGNLILDGSLANKLQTVTDDLQKQEAV